MIPLKDDNPAERFPVVTIALVAVNLAAFWWQVAGVGLVVDFLDRLVLVFIVMTLFRAQEGTEVEINYTQYQGLLANGEIKSGVVKKSDLNNYDFHGTLKKALPVQLSPGKTVSTERFKKIRRDNLDNIILI